MKDIKSLLGKLDSLNTTKVLTESEQVSIAPAQSNTQVIKQGDKVVGTVTNPALAAQLKSAIGKGEMSLNNTDNLNQLQETETEYAEGDRVTVTGDVQMSGQSGTVDALGIGGKFVIVKFDDGSKHSFHSSDLSPEEESDEDDDGFGFIAEDEMTEVVAPGQEVWIKANKEKFINQYGKDKGMRVLYATAWKRSKKNESMGDQQEFTDFEQWRAAVVKAYPGKKFKFAGRMEGGQQTISAEIPGEDRSYGVWDQDTESGVVLTELNASTYQRYIDKKKTGPAPKSMRDASKDLLNMRRARELKASKVNKDVKQALGDPRYMKSAVEESVTKNIKRSFQGWGDGVTPNGIKSRASGYSDDELQGLAAGYDELRKARSSTALPTDVPKHSPAGFQKRVVDREMKKRGLTKGDQTERLGESAGASDTLSHILNKFKHEVKQFELGEEIDVDLYDALFDYWADAGEIPYGVAKGRDGDPVQWVSDKLSELLLNETHDEGMNMATPDMQFEAWDRELTNLLNEGLTVSTSTGGASGMEDSVTVSATGSDAGEIMQILKAAGVGHFGSSKSEEEQEVSAYGAPINSDVVGHEEFGSDYESEEGSGQSSDEEGDDIMSLIKQMFGGASGDVEVELVGDEGQEAGDSEECCDDETEELGTDDSDEGESSEEDENKEEVDEAYANEPDTSEADLEYITNTVSGGLNKQKRDQTVGNPTKVSMAESEQSLTDWLKLSGIKK